MASIQDHRQILEQRLADSGWTISRRDEPQYWWAAEIWQITSDWKPKGLTLHLVFLLEPCSTIGAPPERNVYAVAATRQSPTDHFHARIGAPAPQGHWDATLTLGRRWERDIGAFFAALSALRDHAAGGAA